ncbi:MAG TPA: hypothetical protein VI911_11760 [Patescibacteria group bacterium]|nr:hypothetical protein [Patescibacteria group bacterium]
MEKSNIIFKNLEIKLSQVLDDPDLAKSVVEMNKVFAQTTRKYVDIHARVEYLELPWYKKLWMKIKSTQNNLRP